MRPNLLVNRYAKAFLQLAIQNNLVDKALDDLLLVKSTIEGNKELDTLIHQPFVSKERKTNIINRLFTDRIATISLNLINLLIEKNRDAIITDVYDEYYDYFKYSHKSASLIQLLSAEILFCHSRRAYSVCCNGGGKQDRTAHQLTCEAFGRDNHIRNTQRCSENKRNK